MELNSGNTKLSIVKWLQKGSIDEDHPPCRASNHFHNPLFPWNISFMSDDTTPIALVIRDWCNKTGWPFAMRKSDVTWATGYLAPAPDGPKDPFSFTVSFINGPNNWDKAREYYYKALTTKKSADRESDFADTFKAVGQVLHLLEDIAVPSHTRNDFQSHLIENENKTPFNPLTWYKSPYEYYFQNNSTLITAATPVFPTFDNTKLTDFWDTDQYKIGNVPPSGQSIGLAEFTNANYFSDFTMLNNKPTTQHTFTYPFIAEADYQGGYQICSDRPPAPEYGIQLYRKYISRKIKGPCAQITPERKVDHFAAVSLLDEDNTSIMPISSLRLWLDENVHKTYSKELLPAAIGYSAKLLDYFFRGDIRLEYTTTPNPGYVIVNRTEENLNGLFQIFYDNKNKQRIEYMNGNFSLNKLSTNPSGPVHITAPADAEEPGKYILVFKGNMGNEKGAIAGYVTSRLLEITPPDQFIYSMVDASSVTPQFTEIKAKVRNTTTETMQNGTLIAIAKYKKTTDDLDFLYAISTPEAVVSLTSSAAEEYSFNFTGSPIPVDATDLYLEIAFKGTIGNEQDAVAVGIKDISEPTPIDIFNNTDKTCINNNWYVSGSTDAITAIDAIGNNNGEADESDIYPHLLKNIYIKISSPATPQPASSTVNNFAVQVLDAGQFKRAMYILTDYQFKYSFNTTWDGKDSNNDLWGHYIVTHMYPGKGVKNQTDYTSDPAICGADPVCYNYTYPKYYSIRGNDMWWGGGIAFINAPYPTGTSCQGY